MAIAPVAKVNTDTAEVAETILWQLMRPIGGVSETQGAALWHKLHKDSLKVESLIW